MRAAFRSGVCWVGLFAVAMVAAVLLPHPAYAHGASSTVSHLVLTAPLFVGATSDVLGWLRGSRAKPQPVADGSTAQARANRYLEQIVRPLDRIQLADEGAYFTAVNATPGTGIAQQAAITAFSDTTGFFVLRNTAAVGSGIRVYLDYLKLILTAATTAVQSVDFLVKLDTIVRSPSTAANGTTLTPVNVNIDDSSAAALQAIAYNGGGAMTIPASSAAARVATRIHAPTGLHFAGDLIEVRFDGMPGDSTQGLTAVRASGPSSSVVHGAPIVIGPQETAVIHRWSLSEAAAVSYEYELAWFERAA